MSDMDPLTQSWQRCGAKEGPTKSEDLKSKLRLNKQLNRSKSVCEVLEAEESAQCVERTLSGLVGLELGESMKLES